MEIILQQNPNAMWLVAFVLTFAAAVCCLWALLPCRSWDHIRTNTVTKYPAQSNHWSCDARHRQPVEASSRPPSRRAPTSLSAPWMFST